MSDIRYQVGRPIQERIPGRILKGQYNYGREGGIMDDVKSRKIITYAVLGLFFVISVFLIGLFLSSNNVHTWYIDEQDHRLYQIDEVGTRTLVYPDQLHDPDTCPLCISRRQQYEAAHAESVSRSNMN